LKVSAAFLPLRQPFALLLIRLLENTLLIDSFPHFALKVDHEPGIVGLLLFLRHVCQLRADALESAAHAGIARR
jgi:hypothetical protein